MKLTVSKSAYSSVVGQGLALQDESGRIVGQIALLNSTELLDYKAYASAVANALDGREVSVPDEALLKR